MSKNKEFIRAKLEMVESPEVKEFAMADLLEESDEEENKKKLEQEIKNLTQSLPEESNENS